MKAIIFPKYGSPAVLELREVAKPTPKEQQILVKVQAAAANPLDWHRMRADPFLVRLGDGFFTPKDPRLGADVAGVVEAVGSAVTQFRVGDEVFGDVGAGAFAEYVCATEKHFVKKPANVPFEAAAAVPVAALTALQGLRDHGRIQAGQKVLINGAAGGIGTFAVQLAKHFGAEVTGVCSTRNVDLVKTLGAEHVIDYTREDFTRSGKRYDLVLDNVANYRVTRYPSVLTPRGVWVSAGFSTFGHLLSGVFYGMWLARTTQQRLQIFTANINQADMTVMQELLAAEKVTPIIDRCYPLTETAEAIRYLETGRARGKVIVTVA
jgi:NADPH:quinone reductase-like Zn-dependent oxidoreductase